MGRSATRWSAISLSVVVAIAALVSSGCVEEPTHEPREAATVRQSIKGGEYDYNHPSVVGMFSTATGGVCSGTLIAPNLVLTARHCVAQVESAQVICGSTDFGATQGANNTFVTTEPRLSRDPSIYYRGKEVHVVEGSTDMCNNDIALIVLSENVPASEALPIPPRVDGPVERGEVYTALGYGHTGDGGGAGVRRILEDLEAECNGSDCPSYSSVQNKEWLGDGGTCQGDSGGGAFDEYGRVLGALSRGAAGCRSSVYSGVYGHREWIREVGARAAELGEYDEPTWVADGTTVDPDQDGQENSADNCPIVPNEEQRDLDDDGIGDSCDTDTDGDGVGDDDNCSLVANPDQLDSNDNGEGDACEGDVDGDDVGDDDDNCPFIVNPEQIDVDDDDIGDICDDEITNVVVLSEPGSSNAADDGCSVTSGGSPMRLLGHAAVLLLLLGAARVRELKNQGLPVG